MRPLSRCSSTISGTSVDLDVLVEDAVGVDQRHRAHDAGAQAAGLDDLDLAGQSSCLSSSSRSASLTPSAPEAMQPPPVQIEDVTSHVSHVAFSLLTS